jgi:hypothetical protein
MVFAQWSSNPALIAVLSAGTAFFTTVLATPVRYFVDKRALRHQLRAQYEHDQRKQLKELIGRYHGRLVEAADAWHNRMNNLYKYERKGRLDVGGRYAALEYYFETTVYRFLVLSAVARRLEAEAFFFDARIAEEADLGFIKFAKAFRWVMTDLELVEGIPYDAWGAPDHFLTDRLRSICDACCEGGEVFTLEVFGQRAGADPTLVQALEFFDGLSSDEDRLRWDRLVCLHLLTMTFLNVAGYDIQRSSDELLERTAARIRNEQIRANLVEGLRRFGLADQPEAQRLIRVLIGGPTEQLTWRQRRALKYAATSRART